MRFWNSSSRRADAEVGGGIKVRSRTNFNQEEAKKKYSGIDLHSNNSVVTVTDEEDRVVAEKRKSGYQTTAPQPIDARRYG